MSRARPGRTLRRILIALAVLVLLSPAAFIVTYRIVAKKLLGGPALRAEINLKPEELFIDWDEAVSTWPGRVTVKNLSIRGSDPNVQWIVTLPEASLRYALGPLLRRTFVVTELRPKSVQFRIRQKLPPERVSDARVRALPPIPGFGDPPLRVEGQVLPPPPPNPFTIEVQDVATDAFDDIWFDGCRYRGPAKLRGRFRLKPGNRAQIGPASVVFDGGGVAVGETPAVKELSGTLEATFAEWDVQELKDEKVWQVVTAKVELSGPTQGVDFLEGALQLGPHVRVSGGPGHFSLAGEIDHGNATGDVEITAKGSKYTRPGLAFEGTAQARLKVASWALDGGPLEIGGSSLKLADVRVPGAEAKAGWWGEFDVRSGRLGKGLTGKVAVRCKDGRPLLAFLGEGLPKWTAGLIDTDGLTATADVVLSEPRTAIRGLEAKGGKFTIEGEYDRRGENARGAFLIETGILILGVELDNGKAILRPLLARQWFAKARSAVFEPATASAAKSEKREPKSAN
jgi:hypothetical protein